VPTDKQSAVLTRNKGEKARVLRVQVSELRKNHQLHFQRLRTLLGWLVGTEEITFHCQSDWPLSLSVLTPLHLQLKGSVVGRENHDCPGALDFPSCRGFERKTGEIVGAAACPSAAKLVVKWQNGRRAGRAETPFASFVAGFSTLSSLRHSLWVLPRICALGEVQGWCRKVQILCCARGFVGVV